MPKDTARMGVGGIVGNFSSTSTSQEATIDIPDRANYVMLQVPGSSGADGIVRFDGNAPTAGDSTTGFVISANNDSYFGFYLMDGANQLNIASATSGTSATFNHQFYSVNISSVAP